MAPHERPSSEDRAADADQATGLIPFAGVSPLRDSAGFAPDFAGPHHRRHLAGGRDTVILDRDTCTAGLGRAALRAFPAAQIGKDPFAVRTPRMR